uniref:CvpA family protein n=2 Tax=Gelidibacter sp. TaxID=2018083 RepID=UPI00404A8DC5
MTVLDIVLLVLLGFGLVKGFMNGLFVEVASLVALVAGVYGAIHFSSFVGSFLENRLDWNEKTINIAAFAITFVIIVLVISLAGKALTKIADFAALGIINKLLGAAFGFLKLALIASVILVIFDSANKTLPLMDEKTTQDSMLYKPVKAFAPMILPSILNLKDDIEEVILREKEELQSRKKDSISTQ